jgi:hypothetical protein
MSPVPSPRPDSRSSKDSTVVQSSPTDPPAPSVAVIGSGADVVTTGEEPRPSRSSRGGESAHVVRFASDAGSANARTDDGVTAVDTADDDDDDGDDDGDDDDVTTTGAVLSSTSDFVPVPSPARTVIVFFAVVAALPTQAARVVDHLSLLD